MAGLRNTYYDNKKLTVVNMFGGPGVGKSTTAAEVFAKMKKANMKVELVHEVAKDFIWEEAHHIFGEQDFIFALQNRLIRRLTRHDIDFAIVDSSILLSLFYFPYDFPITFKAFVEEAFYSYDNLNIILDRNPDIPYIQVGRNETEEQAVEKDNEIHMYFHTQARFETKHHHVTTGDTAADACFKLVQQHVNPHRAK